MIHILYGRDYYITTIIPGVKSRQRARNAGHSRESFPSNKTRIPRVRERQDKTCMRLFLFRSLNVMHIQFCRKKNRENFHTYFTIVIAECAELVSHLIWSILHI